MSQMQSSELRGRTAPPSRVRARGAVPGWPSSGLLLAGLAVVALGWPGLDYLGPDLIRYLKIRNM